MEIDSTYLGPVTLQHSLDDTTAVSTRTPLSNSDATTTSTRPTPDLTARRRRRHGTVYVHGQADDCEQGARKRRKHDGDHEDATPGTESRARKRKLSAAQDVIERARERWAALEKLNGDSADKENMDISVCGATQGGWDGKEKCTAESKVQHVAGRRINAKIDTDSSGSRNSIPVSVTFVEPSVTEPVPRAIPRPLRCRALPAQPDELEPWKIEAMRMVVQYGHQGRYPCVRAGCHAVLKDVNTLARHLHLHDIQPDPFPARERPGPFSCRTCGGTYESSRELWMHDCARHRDASSTVMSTSQRLKGRLAGLFNHGLPKLGCVSTIRISVRRARRG